MLLDIPYSKSDRPIFQLAGAPQGLGVTLAVPLRSKDGWSWHADLLAWARLTGRKGAFLPAYDARTKRVDWTRPLT